MLFDEGGLQTDMEGFCDQDWLDQVSRMTAAKVRPDVHGDLPRWLAALESLPAVSQAPPDCSDGAVWANVDLSPDTRESLSDACHSLIPWRKGPFRIGDQLIDAEWRSDLKWNRIETVLGRLDGKRVLDVGCGNGYYALRMHLAGADLVLGIDPSVLFLCQFAAFRCFLKPVPVHLLPLRLEELPSGGPQFDLVCSMGVLYHRRDPLEHLRQLADQLRGGGQLLLETLIIPGAEQDVLVPDGRYARMRNVWHLPSAATLLAWLQGAGYRDLEIVDQTSTSRLEQRSTDWMPFDSLKEALDPDDCSLSVEGLPAPLRAVISARLA